VPERSTESLFPLTVTAMALMEKLSFSACLKASASICNSVPLPGAAAVDEGSMSYLNMYFVVVSAFLSEALV